MDSKDLESALIKQAITEFMKAIDPEKFKILVEAGIEKVFVDAYNRIPYQLSNEIYKVIEEEVKKQLKTESRQKELTKIVNDKMNIILIDYADRAQIYIKEPKERG
jgi:endo-alpha-1,4-polygalactosaminidase (GH114 family)